jgi:hypothetical protein
MTRLHQDGLPSTDNFASCDCLDGNAPIDITAALDSVAVDTSADFAFTVSGNVKLSILEIVDGLSKAVDLVLLPFHCCRSLFCFWVTVDMVMCI